MSYLSPVSFHGLAGYCTGWAGDNKGTVYASFIGRQTAITGIWAAFQDREVLRTMDAELRKLEVEGAKYHTLKTKLPESGWMHLVLLHTQATTNNLPDQDFYVLAEEPNKRPPRFWAMWNRALPFPAHPDWRDALWNEGTRAGLITPVAAEGIHCWKVSANHEAWAKILKLLARR